MKKLLFKLRMRKNMVLGEIRRIRHALHIAKTIYNHPYDIEIVLDEYVMDDPKARIASYYLTMEDISWYTETVYKKNTVSVTFHLEEK